MNVLSPAYDNKIARKYSARTIEHKMENKLALQEAVGWIEEPKVPVICIPTGMSDELGGELLMNLLPGLLELPVSIAIRGRGGKKYGEMFLELAKTHSHRIAIVGDDDVSIRKLLAGSDMALFLSPSDQDGEVENALRYGAIPISPAQSVLENYNPVQETGNAFIYEQPTVWQCYASVVRAVETFKFPYDWRTIQRHAMDTVDRKTQAEVEA